MIWYTYFFLNRGKPSTHIAALSSIDIVTLKRLTPPVLERMMNDAEKILQGDDR